MPTRFRPILACIAAIAACDGSQLQDVPAQELLLRLANDGCPVPDRLAPVDWRVFEASAFTFRIPDGFTRTFVQPVDSETALFTRGTEHLSFDFELFALAPGESSSPPLEAIAECETVLRNRALHLSLFREDGLLRVVAHWPDFAPGEGGTRSLSFVGTVENRSTVDDVLSAVLSVQSSSPPAPAEAGVPPTQAGRRAS